MIPQIEPPRDTKPALPGCLSFLANEQIRPDAKLRGAGFARALGSWSMVPAVWQHPSVFFALRSGSMHKLA